MAQTTPGAVLRQLQQAQAGMKKVRQSLAQLRGGEPDAEEVQAVLRAGWASLSQTYRLLAEIPLAAATDPVLTRQIAVQRYATALLVRLRRLTRAGAGEGADVDDEEADDVT